MKVIPIKDGTTHVKRVDDLDSALQFSDSVGRLQSESYRYYGGTVSTLKEPSDAFSYTFTGTGISILGNNLAGAKIKITLDGREIESRYAVKATEHRAAFYQLSGLGKGEHTIRVELVNEDILHIDAIEIEEDVYSEDVERADRLSLKNEALELAYGESVSLGAKLEPENADENYLYDIQYGCCDGNFGWQSDWQRGWKGCYYGIYWQWGESVCKGDGNAACHNT